MGGPEPLSRFHCCTHRTTHHTDQTSAGIGLNYLEHAHEAKLALPPTPILFLKPSTALTSPFPSVIPVPKSTLSTNSADYESELGVIISRDAKDVPESEALDYVLGYTATNDVSSRITQFETSQW